MTTESHPTSVPSADGKVREDRLGSWKEIASYLQSGVRTVQRWERLEGLPVHRHLHNKLGTVYAFKSEVDTWRNQRRSLLTEQTTPGNGPAAGPSVGQSEGGEGTEQFPPVFPVPPDLSQEVDDRDGVVPESRPEGSEPVGELPIADCRLPIGREDATTPVFPIVNRNPSPRSGPIGNSSSASPNGGDVLIQGPIQIAIRGPATPNLSVETPEPALSIQEVTQPSGPQISSTGTRVRRAATIGLALAVGALAMLTAFLIRRALRPETKPQSGRVMLGVLPFVNLTDDPEQDYFSDGLTEEMITALGRMDVARLGVIARTSSMKYKHTTEDVAQIGRELGVEYVLEGSVRRAGNGARISAQLIQVSDQTHLWAQNYDRRLSDPLTVQEDVAQAVADRIFAALARPAPARANNPRPVDPEAHEDYLKGRYSWNRRSLAGLQKGVEYFNRAVEKAPNYALAYSGLADCYTLLGLEGFPSREVMPKAKAAALKSAELDDSLAQAHTSLGGVKAFYEWDWPGAETEFKRAIALNANYAPAHHWYANLCLLPQRRFEEAIAEMKRALELDPASPIINTDLGWTYDLAGQPDKALEQYRRTQELDPDFVALTNRLAQFYVRRRMYSEAVAMIARQLKAGGHPELAVAVEREFATGGYRKVEEARIEALRGTPGSVNSEVAAGFQASMGNKDKAVEALETAYRDRDPGLIYLEVDPDLASLRSDSRFQRLARSVGLLH
ncbi:MAG: tetratricopeptide repeat protein [Terriglobia bacterium]